MSVVGQTKTSGFQIGVSRTFQCTPEHAWKVLFSRAGRRIWLNTNKPIPTKTGSPYRTIDGIHGEIRSYYDAQKIRLTWQPQDRSTDTTLQVTVSGKAGKTAL